MPRLPPLSLHHAARHHPFLPRLLLATRDLQSARNELRWLLEHLDGIYGAGWRSIRPRRHHLSRKTSSLAFSAPKFEKPRQIESSVGKEILRHNVPLHHLDRLTKLRARGCPLQYLLGSEFFGDLELAVRPGVLIPRPETANIASYLADIINNRRTQYGISPADAGGIKVLDLCTGSGCIPLLLSHLLQPGQITGIGIDVSPIALALARRNRERVASAVGLQFVAADMLQTSSFYQTLSRHGMVSVDVVTANPPYISSGGFNHSTSRSVRIWEPTIALVPPDGPRSDGDLFYPHTLRIAAKLRAKLIMMEVGDIDQARRVARSAVGKGWKCEIWRDEPGRGVESWTQIDNDAIVVKGEGNGRAVLCWQ